jgi:valyl-tRNA synthetase
MVRHLALFGETPFRSVLINGMVLGQDGRKMSKSLKNYMAAPEALNKYGADAIRQWAAGGGATGSDIPYRVQDVEYGRRFLVKLWNASGFASKLLADYDPNSKAAMDLQLLDRWMLSQAQAVTKRVTEAYEKCQFNIAVEEIRNFTWHMLCDCYLEAVKDRLYRPEMSGQPQKVAAQSVLYSVLYRVLQLLSPVVPHLSEEIYQCIYADAKGYNSLHISPWPQCDESKIDAEAEKQGNIIMGLISEVRREKAEKRMPLNMPIKVLTVHAGEESVAEAISSELVDICGACKVEKLKVLPSEGEGRALAQFPTVHFIAEYAPPVPSPKT